MLAQNADKRESSAPKVIAECFSLSSRGVVARNSIKAGMKQTRIDILTSEKCLAKFIACRSAATVVLNISETQLTLRELSRKLKASLQLSAPRFVDVSRAERDLPPETLTIDERRYDDTGESITFN